LGYFTTFDLKPWNPTDGYAPLWDDTTTLPVDVRRYILRFRLTDRYLGFAHTTLVGIAREDLDSLVLDFYGYTVDSVRVAGLPSPYIRDSSRLIVYPTPTLGAGDSVVVDVFYHGSPDSVFCPSFSGGIYVRTDGSFSTLGYPEGFRCWVPSYDRPWEKADDGVEFWIEADTSLTVLANGLLVDTVPTGTTRIWHYMHAHPIATYLISMAGRTLAANRWTWTYGSTTMPVMAWVYPSDTSLGWGVRLTDMLTVFSDRFGVYPFADEKYEQSVVMFAFSGAMEHQTSSHFSSYLGNYTQAHELCHQWWGDDVGYGTFKDTWLGEGFATYCEMLWAEAEGGFASYVLYYGNTVERTFFTYATNPGKPVYDPGPDIGDILSVYTYHKGAAVLHMLRYILDKDTSLFFGALRHYRSLHSGSYALTSDFVDAVETYTGRDLDWFFNQWVYEPGWPVYNVRWNAYPDSSGMWNLTLIVEQTQPVGAPTFRMPIEVRWVSDSADTLFVIWDSLDVQSFTLRWRSAPDSIIWDPDNWILERHTVLKDPSIGVEEVAPVGSRDILVAISGGSVRLEGLPSLPLRVYASDGRLVGYGRGSLRLRLPGGTYFAVQRDRVRVFVVR